MKKLIILFSTVAILGSCSKKNSGIDGNNNNNNNGNPVSLSGKLKTATFEGGVETYSYDNQGRAILITNSDSKKTVYEYTPGLVTVRYFNSAGVNSITHVHELNGNGKSIRRTDTNKPGYEELRDYNADGTLKKSTVKDGAVVTVHDYFYSDGNLEMSKTFENGIHLGSIMYTYYSDKINNLSNVEKGSDFTGKPNKNLLKSVSYEDENGFVFSVINSQYEFDAKGRVIKLIETLEGGTPEIGTYTYYE
jgi:YD repeat-containing protein